MNTMLIGDGLATGCAKIALLINGVSGANAYAAGTPDQSTGAGKIVNMVNGITTISNVATLLNGVTTASKLYDLINGINYAAGPVPPACHGSTLIVSLVNAIPTSAHTSMNDMVILLNTIATASDPGKLASMLTTLNGTKDQLMIDLMAPTGGGGDNVAWGTGAANLGNVIHALASTTEANTMAALLALMAYPAANQVYYKSASKNIDFREAMVRFVAQGVKYDCPNHLNLQFPGFATHIADMINPSYAVTAQDLYDMLSGAPLESMMQMTGCGDMVSVPGFLYQIPCCTCGDPLNTQPVTGNSQWNGNCAY
jgi:hypothetical protein